MKNRKKRKKLKIRRNWDRNPATQVHRVDTDYNRTRDKQEWLDDAQSELDVEEQADVFEDEFD